MHLIDRLICVFGNYWVILYLWNSNYAQLRGNYSQLEGELELDPFFKIIFNFLFHFLVQILFGHFVSSFFAYEQQAFFPNHDHFNFPSILCVDNGHLFFGYFLILVGIEVTEILFNEGGSVFKDVIETRFGAVHGEYSVGDG